MIDGTGGLTSLGLIDIRAEMGRVCQVEKKIEEKRKHLVGVRIFGIVVQYRVKS